MHALLIHQHLKFKYSAHEMQLKQQLFWNIVFWWNSESEKWTRIGIQNRAQSEIPRTDSMTEFIIFAAASNCLLFHNFLQLLDPLQCASNFPSKTGGHHHSKEMIQNEAWSTTRFLNWMHFKYDLESNKNSERLIEMRTPINSPERTWCEVAVVLRRFLKKTRKQSGGRVHVVAVRTVSVRD